ncbi:MAG: flavin-dependent monooxygenase, partial [Pseudomonadota bacterium]|nr:flavin-dependent monooxygenase [Pseudomonadota bacterium]
MSQAAVETNNMPSINVAPVLSLIEKNAPEGKENRQLPDSSIEALREQGFFRMLLPKIYGG